MATKILWQDKQTFEERPEVPVYNKVIADDMNKIKEAVNDNADELDAIGLTLSGLFQANGDGSQTDFTVFHDVQGLYVPIISAASGDSFEKHWIFNATSLQFQIRFENPPPAGVFNVSFYYIIKKA